MSDLERRLAAVERALTDAGDRPPADLPDAAATADRLDDLEDRLSRLEGRLANLEGDVAAVRGYVGECERADAETERIAQAALAAVEELEGRLDDDPRPRVPATGAPLVTPSADPPRDDGLLARLRRLW